MEDLKIWILSVSGATAITAIFKILLSKARIENVVNIFFSIFILFYTIIPLKASFENIKINYYQNDESYEYNVMDSYSKIIELSIKNICDERNIKIDDISIDAYINDNGYLYVNSIVINIENSELADSLKKTICDNLGFEVVVN